MMNQKDLKFLGVVALATIVLSALLNLLVLKLIEKKKPLEDTDEVKDFEKRFPGIPKGGPTVKEVVKSLKDDYIKNMGVGDELMYMSAVDGAFWLSNSLMMAVYVCLGVVAGQQAVKAKLI